MQEPIIPNKIGPYQLKETIGIGAYATVKLAYRPDTKKRFACKIIMRQRLRTSEEQARFEGEIRIMQQMRNNRIAQLFDLLSDSLNYYVFIEFCPNGDLNSLILSKGKLSEEEAKPIFLEILEAIKFIHSLNVAHRDLKPENILLDERMHIKVTDFGFSKFMKCGLDSNNCLTTTSCGSPCYAAPEVILGRPYNAKKSDVWSLGVILYAITCGQLPWTKKNQKQLYMQIINADYAIPPFLSQSCSNLIKSMLQTKVESRINIEEVMNHAWFEQNTTSSLTMNATTIGNNNNAIPEMNNNYLPLKVTLRALDKFFEKDKDDDDSDNSSFVKERRCLSFSALDVETSKRQITTIESETGLKITNKKVAMNSGSVQMFLPIRRASSRTTESIPIKLMTKNMSKFRAMKRKSVSIVRPNIKTSLNSKMKLSPLIEEE